MSTSSGEKVPMVFFPRFSTFAGTNTFRTTPIDMLGFGSFSVTSWRGILIGASNTFAFWIEESPDLETWAELGTAAFDPGANLTSVNTLTPTQRYVRMSVILTKGATDEPTATCWAVGFAERTVT